MSRRSRSSTINGSFSSTVDSLVASSEDTTESIHDTFSYIPENEKEIEAFLFGNVREMKATGVLNDVLEPKTFARSSSQSYIHDLVSELTRKLTEQQQERLESEQRLYRKLEAEKQARVESEERLYQHLAADEQARREFEQGLGQQFEQMLEHQRLVMEMFRDRDVTAKIRTSRSTLQEYLRFPVD